MILRTPIFKSIVNGCFWIFEGNLFHAAPVRIMVLSFLRIQRRFSMVLKISKKLYEVMFFVYSEYVSKYVYSESPFNTLYTEINVNSGEY